MNSFIQGTNSDFWDNRDQDMLKELASIKKETIVEIKKKKKKKIIKKIENEYEIIDKTKVIE
jgi:hypothetical protein